MFYLCSIFPDAGVPVIASVTRRVAELDTRETTDYRQVSAPIEARSDPDGQPCSR
jgi:hypothetical protein